MEGKRAELAAASIQPYGEELFTQVFRANPDVYAAYKKQAEAGLSTLTFEIAGSSAFHALHWEALKDLTLPHPFALDATMLRKNLEPVPFEASVRPSPTINLLVVTARPNGIHDVGYRTISLPLVEALRQADIPVQIDFVRPGTYVALEQHLDAMTAQHGEGYYHVIHFDVHGAVLTSEQLQQGRQTNRYLFQQRPGFGRPDLPTYQGERAFLFLQGTEVGQADPIEGSELAEVLSKHQIPIALLNACQSGKVPEAHEADGADAQDAPEQPAGADRRESSLGQHLMQAGVQVVLAMSYSVTVSAAERLMPDLYRHLFARADLATAIRFARNGLATHKARRAYYNYQIDLEDWLLPVVYQNGPVQLGVRPFTSEEDRLYYERQATRYQEPATSYRFVGRDLDVLEIERCLLTVRTIVLIRGMGGAGKTTLLHHLATWWQSTHLVEGVFSFGYDERAWTREEIVHQVAEQLVGEERYKREFQPLSPDARQSKLAALLRATRHLLILDNLESITGTNFAILNTLPATEQDALRRLLADLAGGKTLVLLGSRGDEAWLAPQTFENNRYTLGGLDSEAASTLTDLILERHHATQYQQADSPEHAALRTLLTLLDGFPLALQIVLANLARQTPSEILAALQAGSKGLDATDEQDKTRSILRCIDYSHSNLSPDAQNLLLCLAPFTSVFDTDLLEAYTEQLKQSPLLATLSFERWPDVLREAQQWGLLAPDANLPTYLHLQPVFPYFLRTRLQAPEAQERRAAIDTAFRQLYDRVGYTHYTYLQAKEPEKRRAGQVYVQLEYENMVTALRLALAARASILDPFRALDEYLRLSQEPQRGLALAQMVQAGLHTYPAEVLEGLLEQELAGVLDAIAQFQLILKLYAEAEKTYLQELAMWVKQIANTAPERKKQLASVYHQLGRVVQEQRQWPQAEQYYQQALQIYEEFHDRYEQALTYHQLGRVAQEQRQWPQAQAYLLQALTIFGEYKDEYSEGMAFRNLARLWRASGEKELPAAVAEVVGGTASEVERRFRKVVEE